MPSIEKRANTYKIIVSAGYDSKGKKIRKSITWEPPAGLTPKQEQKALQAAAVEFEEKVKNCQHIDSSITLSAFVERWLAEYAVNQIEETTLDSYKYELDTKILKALGHVKLAKLQPPQITSFLNSLLKDGCRLDRKAGGYADRTVKYQHAILSSVLQTAVYWQVIPNNPCERVKVPKNKNTVHEKKQKHYTYEETIIFLDAVQKEELKYKAVAYVALFGGLRRGEIAGLMWEDVDFDHGRISVKRSSAYLPDKGVFIKATKTAGSEREITLPESVMTVLRQYRQEQSEHRLKLGELWQNSGMLFTTWDGRPMHPSTPYQWLNDFTTRQHREVDRDENIPAGQKALHKLPRIPFHGLRHTNASLMIANNSDIKTVSTRLGHAQVGTTLDIYSHALRHSDKAAADALEDSLLSNRPSQTHKPAENSR